MKLLELGDGAVKSWVPRDGDTIFTEDKIVFYVFGYEHPSERIFSFLKYVPSSMRQNFPVRFLSQKWRLGRVELARPEKLYTVENFQIFFESLRKFFPHYLYFCAYRGKNVISVPLKSIRKVYVPRECLRGLFRKKRKDTLQRLASELISLLSAESDVPLEDLGIHGSLALNMHSAKSDIDLVVYGSDNFRKLEMAVKKLADEATFRFVFTKKLDWARKHRGRYREKRFVYNATRKFKEISSEYGDYKYHTVKPLRFSGVVADDSEAMFRPAIYKIDDYQSLDSSSELMGQEVPTRVVSMIGYYRNVARRGEKIKVSGTLERVENVETGKVDHQVVVGTGIHNNEYILPI